MQNTVLQSEIQNANIHTLVPEEVKRRWEDAASIRGQTLTDFLIAAANKETEETLTENECIRLSKRDQIQLVEMLSKPPQVNEALSKAMRERLRNMSEL